MKNNRKKLAKLVAMALIMSSATIVSAESNKNQEFSLDQVIVTAQRMETRELDTPAATTVITAQELKETGAISVYDALERTIGVHSYSYGSGGEDYGGMMSRVMIRGLDKGTLVLVNGAPINLMNYNSMGVIPLEAVERIEIVKGSNAVLYGAEAMGGVVNIITKKAKGETSGSVTSTYGNYYKDYSLGLNNDKFMFYYQKEYKGEIDQYNRLFSPSSSRISVGKGNKESLYLNLGLTDDLSLNYSYSNNESNYKKWNYSKVTKQYTVLDKNYHYYNKRNNINLVYDNKEMAFKSVLAYNSINLKPGGDSTTDYDLYGINFDNQKTWRLRDGKDSMVTGFSVQREHYGENYTAKKLDRDSYALYGAYTHKMSDKFTATLGLREHFVKANEYDASQNITLPQLQTLYKINDNTSWYTNIGKSFEMPTTSSPFYSSKGVSTAIKLKPQEGWTYETGFKYIDGNKSLKLALFNMEIDNKFKWVKEDTVVPGGSSTVFVQVNRDKFRNKGIELEYSRKLNENWKYNLGASFSNPEAKDGDSDWQQDEAKLQLSAGATYSEKKLLVNANLFFTGKRELAYYNMQGNTKYQDHRIPNRVDLNANVQYSATKNDIITLSGYNLLDRDNPINHTEYWSTPASYQLSYTHKF